MLTVNDARHAHARASSGEASASAIQIFPTPNPPPPLPQWTDGGDLCCVMQAQADALHVAMPEVTTLSNALDRVDNFQQRAKECLR